MTLSDTFRIHDWRTCTLSDVSRKPISYGIVQTGEPVLNGVPCVRVSDMTSSRLNVSAMVTTSEAIHRIYARTILEKDEVLFALRGEIGTVCCVPDELVGANTTRGVARISPQSDVCLPEYLVQYLRSPYAIREMQLRTNGSALQEIPIEQLRKLPVLLPPRDIQQRIATIFACWDTGIRQLSDLIAAKIHFKQGLMQQLLTGQRRLGKRTIAPSSVSTHDTILNLGLSATAVEVERGLNGKSHDEGIPYLGECPPGWQKRRLQELLSTVQRSVVLGPKETYRLVTAKRYRAGIVPREELRGDQIKTATQFETKAGDFLISRRQIVHGACGLVPASLDGAIVSNEYSCLRVSAELDPLFLEYLSHTKYMQQTFFQSSVGVALEKMIFRIDNWLDYEIHLPPLAEQKQIVELLVLVDREIVLLDRMQKAITEQKRGLMQRLLTGELRVKGN